MSATLEPTVGDLTSELLTLPVDEPVAPADVLPTPVRAPILRLLDAIAPPAVEPPHAAPVVRLSVVIPATNAPATLARCLAAIREAPDAPGEIVVVGNPDSAIPADPRSSGPLARAAAARNRGASMATGDVLVFIDSDVEVHPDVFRLIRETLTEKPEIQAIFGCYDDEPADVGVVSQFRNLLHHHVHANSAGTINTFWTGLGAIRREAFEAVGGFPERSMEDVELGMRLAATGASIVLDPRLQGKHLKHWNLHDMVRTDLIMRGAPWIALSLRFRTPPDVLNCGWRHRASATAALGALTAVGLKRPRTAAVALGMFVGLNRSFYGLLLRRRGAGTAAAGVGLHFVHHLTGVASVPAGVALYAVERRREPLSCDSDS